jgi:2-keto-4-pentenoate hydratase
MAREHLVASHAAMLIDARRTGWPAPWPDPALGLADAYAVQDRVFRSRDVGLAGYKLAATSDGARQALGLDAPLVGLIGQDEVMTRVTAPRRQCPTYAEAELLIVLGQDLPVFAAPATPRCVAPAVARVAAAIEICRSRYADDDVGAAALVADNCLLHALVPGDTLSDGWDEALADCEVTLHHSGQDTVSGSAGVVMGHPLLALAWLATWLGRQGNHLRAGQIVATGSITGITAIATDAPVTARFGARGQATAQFPAG